MVCIANAMYGEYDEHELWEYVVEIEFQGKFWREC